MQATCYHSALPVAQCCPTRSHVHEEPNVSAVIALRGTSQTRQVYCLCSRGMMETQTPSSSSSVCPVHHELDGLPTWTYHPVGTFSSPEHHVDAPEQTDLSTAQPALSCPGFPTFHDFPSLSFPPPSWANSGEPPQSRQGCYAYSQTYHGHPRRQRQADSRPSDHRPSGVTVLLAPKRVLSGMLA